MIKKRKISKGLIFLVSVFAFSAWIAAQAKKYEPILGTWDVQTEDGSYQFTFEFTMQGDTLAGKFIGSSGESEMKDLTFENGKLTFSVDVNGMIIEFSAAIDGDNMEGMLSLQYGEANFTGVRKK
jgi:hypothetical protein